MRHRLMAISGWAVLFLLLITGVAAGKGDSSQPKWQRIDTPHSDEYAWTTCRVYNGTPYRLFLPPHDAWSNGENSPQKMPIFKDEGCLKKKHKPQQVAPS